MDKNRQMHVPSITGIQNAVGVATSTPSTFSVYGYCETPYIKVSGSVLALWKIMGLYGLILFSSHLHYSGHSTIRLVKQQCETDRPTIASVYRLM